MTATNAMQGVRLLRRRQVEELVGLRRSAIYALVAAGRFPAPIHLTVRAVAWLENEVFEWVAGRVAASRPVSPDEVGREVRS
jgi:prophage regulatory protein